MEPNTVGVEVADQTFKVVYFKAFLCGGGFNWTSTSATVSARHFPERKYQGTPSQRQESMNSRSAQNVSTSESLATPGS